MVWYGGLRGAVGLGMALMIENASSGVDVRVRTKIMFHVAMVVFPTLMINGTTFPKIYQLLQVYTVPPLREKVPTDRATSGRRRTSVLHIARGTPDNPSRYTPTHSSIHQERIYVVHSGQRRSYYSLGGSTPPRPGDSFSRMARPSRGLDRAHWRGAGEDRDGRGEVHRGPAQGALALQALQRGGGHVKKSRKVMTFHQTIMKITPFSRMARPSRGVDRAHRRGAEKITADLLKEHWLCKHCNAEVVPSKKNGKS